MKKIIYVFGLILSIVYSSNIYSQCVSGNCDNGEGTFCNSNSVYWGGWKNGKHEGYGIEYSNDGKSMYKGNWSNDLKNGYGIFYWESGDRYEGNWLNDKMNGQATYFFPSGNIFVGQYLDNKATENGVYTSNAIKRGCISGDCSNGKGKFIYSNAEFEGYFKNGKRDGNGKMILWNNNSYEGEFLNDFFSGKGKYVFISGDIYDGDWVNSERNGKGTYTWGKGNKEGDRYIGDWYKGERTGYGKYTYKNGKIIQGKFYEGDFKGNSDAEISVQNDIKSPSSIKNETINNSLKSETKPIQNNLCNLKFVDPILKITFIDNRKKCCCCNANYASYKLDDEIVQTKKMEYLVLELAYHAKDNSYDDDHLTNDTQKLSAFVSKNYNALSALAIPSTVIMYYSLIPLGAIPRPSKNVKANKYINESKYCSQRCENDYRCNCK